MSPSASPADEPYKVYTPSVHLHPFSLPPPCSLAHSDLLPFRRHCRSEQTELKAAEDAASSTWQTWHDAKTEGKTNEADLQKLLDEAERKQDDLKALQPIC